MSTVSDRFGSRVFDGCVMRTNTVLPEMRGTSYSL